MCPAFYAYAYGAIPQCGLRAGQDHRVSLSLLRTADTIRLVTLRLHCTEQVRTYNLSSTVQSRDDHTTAVTSRGLLLVGGKSVGYTTELVTMEGESKEDFRLSHGREEHCSIQVRLDTPQSLHSSPQVDQDTMVLTGGIYPNFPKVTEYSGISSGQVTSRPLPDLVTGRYDHACGSYTVAGQMVGLSSPHLVITLTQVLLVTGGYTQVTKGQYLSSTEVISYPDGQAWREVGPLPSPRQGLRGASLDGILHVTGGWDGNNIHNFTFTTNPGDYLDSVLVWDPVAETWSQVGRLDQGTFDHAITALPLDVIENFCI